MSSKLSAHCLNQYFIFGSLMFEWKITAKVVQCQGVTLHSSTSYSLLLGLDNRFSNPSQRVTPDCNSHQSISFNTLLTLAFKTETCELPSSQLQLILLLCEKEGSKKGLSRKQQIIGIAPITIFYPLQDYLRGLRTFRFDKSLDSKATIKAEITLQVSKKQLQIPSHTRKQKKLHHLNPKPRNSSQAQSQSDSTTKKSLSRSERSIQERPLSKSHIDSHSKYKETIKILTQQRNQLYKMSEALYAQLRKCSDERDQCLKQLRKREINESQIKEELQFLKLKVYEYEQSQSHQENNTQQLQLWQLKALNQELQSTVEQKEKIIKELQRKVKESLIALNDFKQEALTARSELIHKESQFSFMSKHSKTLDTAECIQELILELQQRNFQQPFDFTCVYQQEDKLVQMASLVKRDMASLFTKLLGKMKLQRDKEWLLKEKVQFERDLQERVLQFSIYDRK